MMHAFTPPEIFIGVVLLLLALVLLNVLKTSTKYEQTKESIKGSLLALKHLLKVGKTSRHLFLRILV